MQSARLAYEDKMADLARKVTRCISSEPVKSSSMTTSNPNSRNVSRSLFLSSSVPSRTSYKTQKKIIILSFECIWKKSYFEIIDIEILLVNDQA